MSRILEVRGLELEYATPDGPIRALDGADLEVPAGAVIGIVGESGSGKSTLGLAVGRLLPGNLRRVDGDLRVRGRSVFDCDAATMRRMRRDLMGFVFQNPMQALDPTKRVEAHLALSLGGGRASRSRILEHLARVGLRDPDRVARSYPHELSGGMAQRVVIAGAIARNPAILIADEPTASLDATIRDQVLGTLVGLCREIGASMLLLSHELRVVARICDAVAVMYGGRVVEFGEARALFRRPSHPYTRALLRAAPGHERQGELLKPIPGMPPVLRGPSVGCAFAPRCEFSTAVCATTPPPARHVGGQTALCHHVEAVVT
ncbi:MAG TPA: ABC transporter ATP-binding protein [Azospirillaceae bacterium]|nr:ABC transporter ATP-binding protein [Azospirillaceae bacterium]